MAADLSVSLRLRLDGGKVVAAELDKVAGATRKLGADARGAAAGASKLAQEAGNAATRTKALGTAAKDAQAGFNSLRGAMAGLGLSLFIRDALESAKRAQSLKTAMEFASGGAKQAAQDYAFLRQTVGALGLELVSAEGAFKKISAAAQGTALQGEPVRQIFLGVAQAATTLGLSAAETEGALYALSQMISKGTVSSEELKQQLGERLPGAFQVAARAMGVTTQQLGKMLEQGEVFAEDFLPKFAREMQRTFAGSAAQAAGSLVAETNRLSTAWEELKRALPMQEAATNVIRSLTAIVGKTKEASDEVGVLGGVVAGTWEGIKAASLGLVNTLRSGAMAALGLSEKTEKLRELRARAAEMERGNMDPRMTAAWAEYQNVLKEIARLEGKATEGAKEHAAVVKDGTAANAEAFKKLAGNLTEVEQKRSKITAQFQKDKEALESAAFKVDSGVSAGELAAALSKLEGEYKRNLAAADDNAAGTRRLSAAQKEAAKDVKEAAKAQESHADALASAASALNLEYVELTRGARARKELEYATEGLDKAERDYLLTLYDRNTALEQQKEANDKAAKGADFVATAWEEASKRLDNTFADMWRGLLEGTESTFDTIKSLFYDLLAELAHAAITRPILLSAGLLSAPTAATAGGGSGAVSGAVAGAAQAAGGGAGGTGGGGGLLNLAGAGGMLGGNSLGTWLEGVGFKYSPFSTVTAEAPGGLLGGAANYSNMAYGAAGLLGGLGAGALYKNKGYSSVGGGLGAMGGMALGASYGSFGGPIGAVIGSALGGLVGSLFGGKKKKKPRATLGSGDISYEDSVSEEGAFGQVGFSEVGTRRLDAGDFRETFRSITALDDVIAGLVGDSVTDQIRAGISGWRSTTDKVGKSGVDFDRLITERYGRIAELLAQTGDVIAGDIAKVLEKGVDSETFAADLGFAAGYREMFDPQAIIGPFEAKLGELGSAFEQASATANRLGLDVDALTTSFGKATTALKNQFNKSVNDAILALTDPLAAAIQGVGEEFALMLGEAQAIGGDVGKVQELYTLRLTKLFEDQLGPAIVDSTVDLQRNIDAWRSLSDTLRQTRESLLVSELSPLTPEQQYTEASRQFEEVSSAAAGGDMDAAARLSDAAQDFLAVSRDYFASSDEYTQDFTRVQGALEAAETHAETQVNTAQAQLDATLAALGLSQEQLTTMQDVRARVDALIASWTANPLATGEGIAVKSTTVPQVNQPITQTNAKKAKNNDITINQTVAAGFARGGVAPQGLALVGEEGPELIRFMSPAQVFDTRSTTRMLSAANDPVQRRALGGGTSPGLVLVGEEGPELLDMEDPGRVYNASQTAAMTGTDSGQLAGLIAEGNRILGQLSALMEKQVAATQSVARATEGTASTRKIA